MNKRNAAIGCLILLLIIILFLYWLAHNFAGSAAPPAPKPPPLTVRSTGGVRGVTAQGPSHQTGPSSNPLLVQVTETGGAVVSGMLPAGEMIPPNGYVAVVSAPNAIIGGIGVGASTGTTTPTPGEVDVDGANTTLTVTTSGALSNNLILVPGFHKITVDGPLSISSALNINASLTFGVTVAALGDVAFPLVETYTLPSNGQQWGTCGITATSYPLTFADLTAQLTIVVTSPSGTVPAGTIQQTQTISTLGALSFTNLDPNNSNPVPASGIQSIEIDIPQQTAKPPGN